MNMYNDDARRTTINIPEGSMPHTRNPYLGVFWWLGKWKQERRGGRSIFHAVGIWNVLRLYSVAEKTPVSGTIVEQLHCIIFHPRERLEDVWRKLPFSNRASFIHFPQNVALLYSFLHRILCFALRNPTSNGSRKNEANPLQLRCRITIPPFFFSP